LALSLDVIAIASSCVAATDNVTGTVIGYPILSSVKSPIFMIGSFFYDAISSSE